MLKSKKLWKYFFPVSNLNFRALYTFIFQEELHWQIRFKWSLNFSLLLKYHRNLFIAGIKSTPLKLKFFSQWLLKSKTEKKSPGCVRAHDVRGRGPACWPGVCTRGRPRRPKSDRRSRPHWPLKEVSREMPELRRPRKSFEKHLKNDSRTQSHCHASSQRSAKNVNGRTKYISVQSTFI